ncbi:MAG: hypothetical protein ACQEXN_10100 [Actinomycetota bacterium]
MTTGNDETGNDEAPRDPQPNEPNEDNQEPQDPQQSGAGPDSMDVDGKAAAENAKESGGYGY